MCRVLEREDRMCRLEIIGEQEAGARARPVDRRGPALEIRTPAFLDEAKEVAAQAIDRLRLEDGLDRVRDRHDELLHLRAERQPRIPDGERREENVFEATC